MIVTDLGKAVERLGEMLGAARRVAPFTGAGLSTESGIPDFRSPGGLWTRNRPIDYQSFVVDPDMRAEAWRRRFAMQPVFAAAQPSAGHRAIARWYREGLAPGVITQNIDNLHQQSGFASRDVIELHGNTTYAHCISCRERYSIDWVRAAFDADDGAAPDCPACGAPIKTATVSFGQAMPREEMRRASAFAMDCDLFVVLGSSLVVWPAAGLPVLARKNGARLVIVNREATELDSIADLVVRAEIGAVLSPFA